MTYATKTRADDTDPIPRMPSWVASTRSDALHELSFMSGAALSHLHVLHANRIIPHPLLRDRLALRAAEALAKFVGRPERAGDLRDAVHLLRPGDLPGPAGDIFLTWRRAVARPLTVKSMQRALPDFDSARIADWLDVGCGDAVARAATVLEAVMADIPRGDLAALVLADAALAQTLGWDHLMPLLAGGLRHADLRKHGEELRLACHRAVITSIVEAVRLAADLSRRTARLEAVAPKLRAKGAGEAVGIFLTCDAVAPSALPLPDRAARRLCDRLVALGAVRELTGRDTFRLYGV